MLNITKVIREMKYTTWQQNIDSLKTQKQAKKYKPIYDFYMTKNLPTVTALKTNKDITKKTFNISALNKKLNEKLSEVE